MDLQTKVTLVFLGTNFICWLAGYHTHKLLMRVVLDKMLKEALDKYQKNRVASLYGKDDGQL